MCLEIPVASVTRSEVVEWLAARRPAARPPAGAVVWWRAERRSREEAARQAATPISFVHAIALGCAGAAVVGVLGIGTASVRAGFARWWSGFSWPARRL